MPEPHKAVKYQPEPEPDSEQDELGTEHDHFKSYKPGSEEGKVDLDHHEHRNEVDKAEQQDMSGPEQNMPGQKKPDPDEPGTEHDHLKPYKPQCEQDKVDFVHNEHTNMPEKKGPEQYILEAEQNMPGPKQTDPEQHEPGTEHDHLKPYEPGSEQDKVNLDHNKCRNAPEKKGPEQYILEPEQNMPGQNKPDPEKGEPDTGHDHLKPYKPASEEDKVDLDHNEHRNEVDKAEQQDMSGSEQNKQKPNMPGPKQPDLMQHKPGTEHDHLKPYEPGSEQDKVNLDHNEWRNAPKRPNTCLLYTSPSPRD